MWYSILTFPPHIHRCVCAYTYTHTRLKTYTQGRHTYKNLNERQVISRCIQSRLDHVTRSSQLSLGAEIDSGGEHHPSPGVSWPVWVGCRKWGFIVWNLWLDIFFSFHCVIIVIFIIIVMIVVMVILILSLIWKW